MVAGAEEKFCLFYSATVTIASAAAFPLQFKQVQDTTIGPD